MARDLIIYKVLPCTLVATTLDLEHLDIDGTEMDLNLFLKLVGIVH